jgi:hypothetical protein
MGGKQLGFSVYEQSTTKKRTKREKFLAEMEQVLRAAPPGSLTPALISATSTFGLGARRWCSGPS